MKMGKICNKYSFHLYIFLFNFSNNTQYFGTEKEKEDIRVFWTKKRSCCDAVNLIEEYTHSLSNMWHYKWPKGLADIYIEAYNMFRYC